MSDPGAALWARLQAAGLVEGEQPRMPARSAWYARTLVTVSTWLAAACTLAFLFAVFSAWLEPAPNMLLTGLALLAAAAWVLYRGPDHDATEQTGLALSAAGQVLTGVGAHGLVDHAPLAWLLLAVLSLGLAWFIPNRLHRSWSVALAAFCLAAALADLRASAMTSAVTAAAVAGLWLREPRWAHDEARWQPFAWGLTHALLISEAVRVLAADTWLGDAQQPLAAPAASLLTGAVLLGTACVLLARAGVLRAPRVAAPALALASVFAAASLAAPGIASGALIMVLGQARSDARLRGLGLALTVLFTGAWYYRLDATLAEKSLLLALLGVALLTLRALLHRLWAEEGAHA